MTEVYVTIYRHRNGTQYTQVNATKKGQEAFIENLNKDIFWIEAVSCNQIEE